MSEARLHCGSEEEQAALGARLARAVGEQPAVVHLTGDLGAGKTTLVRGFLRGLGHADPVRSPTYTLVEPYPLEGLTLYHLDLYRLGDPEELEYLGLRDLLAEPALVFVEWPERGRGWLPAPDLEIVIRHRDEGRVLDFVSHSPVGERWLRALMQGKT